MLSRVCSLYRVVCVCVSPSSVSRFQPLLSHTQRLMHTNTFKYAADNIQGEAPAPTTPKKVRVRNSKKSVPSSIGGDAEKKSKKVSKMQARYQAWLDNVRAAYESYVERFPTLLARYDRQVELRDKATERAIRLASKPLKPPRAPQHAMPMFISKNWSNPSGEAGHLVLSRLAKQWRNMSEAERQPYVELRMQELEKFKKLKEEWQKDNVPPKRRLEPHALYIHDHLSANLKPGEKSVSPVFKMLVERYKQLPEAERQLYVERAAAMKAQRKQAFSDWLAAHPHKNKAQTIAAARGPRLFKPRLVSFDYFLKKYSAKHPSPMQRKRIKQQNNNNNTQQQ